MTFLKIPKPRPVPYDSVGVYFILFYFISLQNLSDIDVRLASWLVFDFFF